MKYLLLNICILLPSFGIVAQNWDTSKPWTYWWWMGSAVNKADIEWQLSEFSKAGLGGVHIIPIYGVKGEEANFIPFLSEAWMEMVAFTINKANEFGLGVDLTLGTGWPYGGPWIDKSMGAKKLIIQSIHTSQTDKVELDLERLKLKNDLENILMMIAQNTEGEILDLLSKDGMTQIKKQLPLREWKISTFGVSNTNQKVKRAAPGGEGLVMDYFYADAVYRYTMHFDSIFKQTAYSFYPRAFYHDSYEVFGANWTQNFSNHFEETQGYHLSDYLPVLIDSIHPLQPHLRHDIRETMAELLANSFTSTWTQWCSEKGILTRNQAHGSPGNILDLYAYADIPETESFGCSQFPIPGLNCDPDYEENRFGRPSPLMMKMASSPAHLLGKPLVSSETATWLGNHFKVSLRQIKPQIDELFVAGINHIFFHGVTYSPQNEAYPGWLFYASTHFGPTSHFWNELPLLTDYISTCQEYLQGSQPDNQILLYFPTHDLWTKLKGDLLVPLDVHKYGRWFEQSSFGETSNWLWDHGYTFDYISDGQLTNLRVNTSKNLYHNDSISYQCILIPPIDFIEENTLQRLNELAAYGARIVFMERLPEQASGLRARIEKNPEFEIIKTDILSHEGVSVTSRPAEDLKEIGIYREWIKEMGLDFIRKKNKAGYLYFITNLSNKFYADSVILAPSYEYVHLIDPLNGSEGHIKTSGSFFLELPPGKSCIVQASISQPSAGIQHYTEYNDTLRFKEPWTVTFTLDHLESLEFKIDSLTSWTAWDNTDLNTF